MKIEANTPEEYIAKVPEERQKAMDALRKVILDNLPQGFEEVINYNMIGYVVPHSIYPDGYHCNPELPLPFIHIASQKNYIALYHSGMYSDPQLLSWFVEEYPKYVTTKLDMGKSCVRFKKPDQIPLPLIGELVSKMTPDQWIEKYESVIKRT